MIDLVWKHERNEKAAKIYERVKKKINGRKERRNKVI